MLSAAEAAVKLQHQRMAGQAAAEASGEAPGSPTSPASAAGFRATAAGEALARLHGCLASAQGEAHASVTRGCAV